MVGQVGIGRALLLCVCSGVLLLATQAHRGVEAQIQQHLAAAREAESTKDYARAGTEYQKILRLQPDLPIIHQNLGLTYHLRNQFDSAIPEFSRAVQLDPKLWGAFLFLGMDLYKVNHFEKAIAALETSVNLNAARAEPEARFWLGASKVALGRPVEAIAEFRRAADLRPKDVEVLYQLANTYDAEGSALLERMGLIEPRAAAVSLLQAEHFLGENRVDLARVEYRRAVLLRPDFRSSIPALESDSIAEPAEAIAITESDARAILALASYWFARGDDANAKELLVRLRKLKAADEAAGRYVDAAKTSDASSRPTDGEGSWAALFEARRYQEENQFARAEELLRQVLAKEPRNLDALLSLGKGYKKWAATLLDKMIELNPDSYRVHQLRGQQHEARAEYDQALQSYKTALAKQPDLAGVRYAIGNVYFTKRQYDEAEHWLIDELKNNPHHGTAHYRLGSLYTEQGKADEAIAHLQQALESHPGLTAARLDLGRALLLKGRYADAVSTLQKVAAEEPDNDRVHYFISNGYRKMGRNDEANAEMAKYQELTRKRLELTQQGVRDVSRSLEKNK